MGKTSPAVDVYIDRAAPFARPILRQVRAAFHKGCPDLEERIKWGAPAFEHKGILGGMAAFQRHVAWGFWRQGELNDPHRIFREEGMYGGGKITGVAQLPAQRVIVQYVKAAVRLNDAGPKRRPPRPPKPAVVVPPDLRAALRANRKAFATFEGLSPSCRREYVEWITEAKRQETRERRLATSLEWLAEGKSLHWKYETCR